MRTIIKLMVNEYKIKKFDFMGYTFDREELSYHHLIIPRRLGGRETKDNGAILNGFTSHPYLHAIEQKDVEIFNYITSEMIDENIKGKLDVDNLRRIHDLLLYFEREHCSDYTRSGKPLIKEKYTRRVKI